MQTDFGALSALELKSWSAKTWKQFRQQSFWFANGFVGTGDNTPIKRVNELSAINGGLQCVLTLVNDMEGDGTVGDNPLTGQEEQLVADAQIIKLDKLTHGAITKGEMAEKATMLKFREEAKDKLGYWLPNKIDELAFLTVSGRAYTLNTDLSTRGTSQLPSLNFAADVTAASTNRIKYAGSATSEATLTAADKMSWDFCTTVAAYAKRKGIQPIREGGKSYYAMVMSPEQKRDLLQDPTYKTIVGNAAERGSNNPLFKNSMAVVQGLILYDHEKVINTTGLASGSKWGSGGTVEGAQACLFGAGALGFSAIGGGTWLEETSDYKRKPGIGYEQKLGLLKPQFKPTASSTSREDYGVIAVKTAAAA